MTKEIDIRGLFCPQPVLLVKKAIDAGEREIVVLADDATAIGNVKRLAKNNGYIVKEVEGKNNHTLLMIKK